MLRFNDDGISWECQECMLGEDEYEYATRYVASTGSAVTRGKFMNMCTDWPVEVTTDARYQRDFFSLWYLLLHHYTSMALTWPRDRPFAFQGIASQLARVSNENASRGRGAAIHFFDGLPVRFLLPSLLWRVSSVNGRRTTQDTTKSGAKTRIEAECHLNTLSWASIEGTVLTPYTWPCCTTASPSTTIFAPGFSSGTFTLRKRTQIVELSPGPKPCVILDTDGEDDLPCIPRISSEKMDTFASYRYCTRAVSLIHVHNLLSRVTLEGPTFSFTTPSTYHSRTMSPGGCMTDWDQRGRWHGLRDSFMLMNLDLGCLRFSHFGLSMRVTCLTVIEWEWDENKDCRYPKDMAREKPESWQPNCAAGIVLIRNEGGHEDVHWNRAEEIYTRIGYWELVHWNPYHPPYGPIRKEAKVKRVTVI